MGSAPGHVEADAGGEPEPCSVVRRLQFLAGLLPGGEAIKVLWRALQRWVCDRLSDKLAWGAEARICVSSQKEFSLWKKQ